MKITPELLASLGFTRATLGRWWPRGLDFPCVIVEYDVVDGVQRYAFGYPPISDANELLNAIHDAGVAEGRKRSATDFRRLIGLAGED